MTARESFALSRKRSGFLPRSPEPRGPAPDSSLSATQQSRWWRALEAAITFSILAVVVLAVADSIAAADWVDDQPDYRLIAVLALAAAALLGSARLSGPAVTLVTAIVGAIVVLWQVLTVDAVAGQPFFFERFDDLWFRLKDWFDQAFTYGISTDTLPFMLFLSTGIWIAVLVGAFRVWRRRNPWILLVAMGVMLSVNVSYLDGKHWDFNFAMFMAGGILLLTRTHLLTQMQRWESRHAPFPDFISLSFLVAAVLALIALLVIARTLPRPDRSDAIGDVWGTIASPFNGLSDELRRVFSGIDSQAGASVHQFSDLLILQGEISPDDTIVLQVQADSPPPGYLRGATYDRYITRGWQQTDLDKESLSAGEPALGAVGSGIEGYRDRREISIRVSAERSSRVLFSLGIPDVVDRDVKAEQSATIPISLDLLDPDTAPLDLRDAAVAILATQIATAQQVAAAYDLLPRGYIVLGHDRAEDGTAIVVHLENLSLGPDVVALRPKDTVRPGDIYEVTGTISNATVGALRSAGLAYPAWVRERFFQLPAELSESDFARLQALAEEVTAATANPFDAALALRSYLCCSPAQDERGAAAQDAEGNLRLRYPFTTAVQTAPVSTDAVTWWLFDNLAADGYAVGGYFDYHASAMAVLLRTLGIPARVSTGFLLSPNENYDAATETYTVRRLHAHTWVEVYFPEYGWVEFDPTPPVEGRPAAQGVAAESLARAILLPRSGSSGTDDIAGRGRGALVADAAAERAEIGAQGAVVVGVQTLFAR